MLEEKWEEKIEDLRMLGLFKIEWIGDGMYCLVFKMYYGFVMVDE